MRQAEHDVAPPLGGGGRCASRSATSTTAAAPSTPRSSASMRGSWRSITASAWRDWPCAQRTPRRGIPHVDAVPRARGGLPHAHVPRAPRRHRARGVRSGGARAGLLRAGGRGAARRRSRRGRSPLQPCQFLVAFPGQPFSEAAEEHRRGAKATITDAPEEAPAPRWARAAHGAIACPARGTPPSHLAGRSTAREFPPSPWVSTPRVFSVPREQAKRACYLGRATAPPSDRSIGVVSVPLFKSLKRKLVLLLPLAVKSTAKTAPRDAAAAGVTSVTLSAESAAPAGNSSSCCCRRWSDVCHTPC